MRQGGPIVSTLMRRLPPLLLALGLLFAGTAARAEIDLPDVKADADRYRARIAGPVNPADDVGAHLQAYKDAARAQRWRPAITELEALLRRSPNDAETWLRLARAWRSLDDKANEITASAYNAYGLAARSADPASSSASDALIILARQFEVQGRRTLAVRTWAEVGRLVSDPALTTQLAEKSAPDGEFAVSDTPPVDANSRAPKWCINFTAPLDDGDTRTYGQWVRLTHLVGRDREEAASAEVSAKDRTLCIFGLAHGERYRLRLGAGLPARDGRTLKAGWSADATVDSRKSDIAFKSNTLVLPINGSGNVPVRSVGVPVATFMLLHVTDRQVINEVALGRLKSTLSPQDARALMTRSGRLVWWGTAELNRERNVEKTSAIAVGAILKARAAWQPGVSGPYAPGFMSDGGSSLLGPGIYALIAIPRRCAGLEADMAATANSPGPCLDSGDDGAELAAQWIDYTGLGLQFVRGSGGLTVAVRSLADGTAKPKIRAQLVSTANRVLGEAPTDLDGLVRFDAGLAKGTFGNRLRGIYALSDDGDFAFLDASQDAFDLSDRGVLGRDAPGAVDVYVWTERGIYRPGEAVPASIMVRDGHARALAPPALTLRLVGPDETTVNERAVASDEFKAGVAITRVILPADAAAGAWRVEVHNGRETVGTAAFQVESFVPARIQFDLAGLSTAVLRPGEPVSMKLTAQYLFGGPAANLSGRYRLSLRRAVHPFSSYESYRFGRDSDQVIAAGPIVPIQRTGADGATQVSVVMESPPRQDFPMEALLRVQLDDTDGSGIGKEFIVPMRRPQQRWVGARLAPVDSASDPTAIELVAVDADGARRAARLRWELFAEDDAFQWSRAPESDQASYEVSTQHTLLGRGERSVGTGDIERMVIDQPPGRYKILLYDDEAGTSTELPFIAGFEGTSRTAGRPDLVRLTLDRPVGEYAPGETIAAHVHSAIPGQLMLMVASDTVYRVLNQALPADGDLTLSLRADEAWGPHPYLLAAVFANGRETRPGPARAVGVTSFSIIPARARLNVAIEAPDETVPRQTDEGHRMPARVIVTGARPGEPVYVSLSAVDAGILSLTDYQLPDPVRYFHGQRRLGVDLLDTYGRLIRDQGDAAPLRSGGDVLGALRGLDYTWPGVVAWVSNPILAVDGRATIEVPVPDFLGRLQLVATAWTTDKAGVTNRPMLVRDPVSLRPDLPRFLAPGDRMTMGFDVINIHAAGGEYTLTVAADLPARLVSSPVQRLKLGVGQRVHVAFDVAAEPLNPATRLATTRIHADLRPVTDDALPTLTREWELPVRSGAQPVTRLVRTVIPPRQALTLSGSVLRSFADDLAPGSVVMRHRVTSVPLLTAVPEDDGATRAMSTDQLASRAAILLSAVVEAGGWDSVSAPLQARFQATLADLLTLQKPDGSFRLFAGDLDSNRDDQLQRTAFVADVLDQARGAAIPVPGRPLKAAGEYLRSAVAFNQNCTVADAYPVLILVRLAQANFDMVDGLRRRCVEAGLPANGDGQVARIMAVASQRAFGFALDPELRSLFGGAPKQAPTLGESVDLVYAAASALDDPRDLGRLMSAVGNRMTVGQRRAGQMPDLGLQERAKLVLASLRAAPAAQEAAIEVNGQALRATKAGWRSDELPLDTVPADFVVRNASDVPLTDELTLRGLPAAPVRPDAANPVLVDRKLFCFEGGLDADHPRNQSAPLNRQQICAVVIEGKMQRTSNDLAVLTEMLPSGWEIETPDLRRNAAIAPEAPAMLKLDTAVGSAILKRVAYPDRLNVLLDLSRAAHGFRFAYLIRAARPGRFAWPAVAVTSIADGTWIGGTNPAAVAVDP